jgi:hypothetical protein
MDFETPTTMRNRFIFLGGQERKWSGGKGERTFDDKPETFRLLMLSIKEEDTTKNKMRHRKHIFKHQKVPHAPFKIHNASQALTHATTFLIQKIIINSKLYYHIWSNQQLQKK